MTSASNRLHQIVAPKIKLHDVFTEREKTTIHQSRQSSFLIIKYINISPIFYIEFLTILVKLQVVRLQDLQSQGSVFESYQAYSWFHNDYRICNVVLLLSHNFLICATHNIVTDNQPMFVIREICCCQLGVYIPLWEFTEIPWTLKMCKQSNKQTILRLVRE